MFVGATGIGRVVQRTVELMKEYDTDDVRPYGGIDVATLQRYLNFHYSVSLDLFGAETSTNAEPSDSPVRTEIVPGRPRFLTACSAFRTRFSTTC